ncbi:hypothetical protein R1sor_012096 [Riccia sorocarpa]|uniref:Xyloglucan endotransglucosylase/hydrolase n=1 Tax=Riccia sorocarpa TaxID=122646 RepID=A0ABD3I6F2_9MARC
MGKMNLALLVLCFSALFAAAAEASGIWDDFYVFNGPVNVKSPGPKVGKTVVLGLTNQTGATIASYSPYLFGRFSTKIKTVKGYSAGTVTSFHMASNRTNWSELDFEFLGNVTGQPYSLQTNVFVEGHGNREQRINLWFDPSAAYHEYAFLWNQKQVLFLVDNIAIRVFKNLKGNPFLDYQPMYVYGSEWDGESWATRGGLDKINWAYAPFEASFTAINTHNACKVTDPQNITQLDACYAQASISTYGQGVNLSLTRKQVHDLRWIRRKFLTYDYCEMVVKFAGKVLPECRQNWP